MVSAPVTIYMSVTTVIHVKKVCLEMNANMIVQPNVFMESAPITSVNAILGGVVLDAMLVTQITLVTIASTYAAKIAHMARAMDLIAFVTLDLLASYAINAMMVFLERTALHASTVTMEHVLMVSARAMKVGPGTIVIHAMKTSLVRNATYHVHTVLTVIVKDTLVYVTRGLLVLDVLCVVFVLFLNFELEIIKKKGSQVKKGSAGQTR